MATEFIAASPTLQAAKAYVKAIEQKWGQDGWVMGWTHINHDGMGTWKIVTRDNFWDVWLRGRPDGSVEVYGEC